MRYLLGTLRRADADFNLIEDGDKIAVGVSGGKDSIALLYALSIYKKFAEKSLNKKIEIVGITMKFGFAGMDFQPIIDFCKKNEIEYHIVPTQMREILEANADSSGRLPCSLCSKFKKAIMIDSAKKLGANKFAFGHHADDAIETLFMNSIFNAKIATFKPIMHLSRDDMTMIRPFIYAYEKEIIKTVARLELPVVQSTCPMDKHTSREDVKQILNELYERYPFAHNNFLKMLSNERDLDLWKKTNNTEQTL